MYEIHFIFLFSPCCKQKTNSGRLGLFDGDRKTKINGFREARNVEINAIEEILFRSSF